MTEQEEKAYERGGRVVATSILRALLRELGYKDRSYVSLVTELESARAVLRGLCETHGDNDWDDTLHLADALDKHLGCYLEMCEE